MNKQRIANDRVLVDVIYHRLKMSQAQLCKIKSPIENGLGPISRFLWGRRALGMGFAGRGIKLVYFSITLCGLSRMRSVNTSYRGIDRETDVLAFPVHSDLRGGNNNSFKYCGEILNIGDILICRPVASKQAKKFGISFEREFTHLMVHGLLHLLGYDHELSLEQAQIMEKLEHNLVNKIIIGEKKRDINE